MSQNDRYTYLLVLYWSDFQYIAHITMHIIKRIKWQSADILHFVTSLGN